VVDVADEMADPGQRLHVLVDVDEGISRRSD
jgi:hypothetical protein